jgi:hypothetical protein
LRTEAAHKPWFDEGYSKEKPNHNSYMIRIKHLVNENMLSNGRQKVSRYFRKI